MRIPQEVANATGVAVTSTAIVVMQDAVRMMLPWLAVMIAVIVCDLMVGIRKSLKLGIHVSISMAFRETMAKIVVYTSFVMMVCMIDSAAEHDLQIARWGCLFICALEGSSIINNFLKPYGICLSFKSIIQFFAKRTLKVSNEEAQELVTEEQIESVRQRERDRWEKRKKHQYGSKKS